MPVQRASRPHSGYCGLVDGYKWDTRIAYAVCMAESGGNQRTANLSDKHNGCVGSYGLMQIACIHTSGRPEYDPQANMQKAYEIYSHSGWQPWGSYTSGKYKRYL